MHQLVQDFFKVRQDDVPGAARVARDSSVETGHVAQTNAGNVMVAGQRTKVCRLAERSHDSFRSGILAYSNISDLTRFPLWKGGSSSNGVCRVELFQVYPICLHLPS